MHSQYAFKDKLCYETIEQNKKKTLYGDYTHIGQVMGINAPAAKMRFFKGDEKEKKDAVENHHQS